MMRYFSIELNNWQLRPARRLPRGLKLEYNITLRKQEVVRPWGPLSLRCLMKLVNLKVLYFTKHLRAVEMRIHDMEFCSLVRTKQSASCSFCKVSIVSRRTVKRDFWKVTLELTAWALTFSYTSRLLSSLSIASFMVPVKSLLPCLLRISEEHKSNTAHALRWMTSLLKRVDLQGRAVVQKFQEGWLTEWSSWKVRISQMRASLIQVFCTVRALHIALAVSITSVSYHILCADQLA